MILFLILHHLKVKLGDFLTLIMIRPVRLDSDSASELPYLAVLISHPLAEGSEMEKPLNVITSARFVDKNRSIWVKFDRRRSKEGIK